MHCPSPLGKLRLSRSRDGSPGPLKQKQAVRRLTLSIMYLCRAQQGRLAASGQMGSGPRCAKVAGAWQCRRNATEEPTQLRRLISRSPGELRRTRREIECNDTQTICISNPLQEPDVALPISTMRVVRIALARGTDIAILPARCPQGHRSFVVLRSTIVLSLSC